ncbi:MAG: multidrug efflux protein [archaeon ADurb.Bin336]|nr:MAG: multidrug efflux protein [archaeon ADurb.Bin336]
MRKKSGKNKKSDDPSRGGLFDSHDLTQGSILRALLFASIPIIFSNTLQVSFQLVDRFWVGQLGTNAVAAITISFPIILVVNALIIGVSIAGTILVGQYKGQKNQKMIDYIATQSMSIVLILSLILGIIGFLSAETLLSFFTKDPEVLKLATDYLRVTFLGTTFIFIYFEYQALLRGVGNVLIPLVVILGAAVLNFFIDPLFIMGYSLNGTQLIPPMGVAGSAWATIFCQGLAGLVGLVVLIRGKNGVHLKFEQLTPQIKTIKRIFILGTPSAIEFLSRSLSGLLVTFLVASFGTIITASYGTGQFLFNLVLLPALGLNVGTSTIVSQCVGAKKIQRLKDTIKVSALISFTLLTLIGLFSTIYSTQLAQIFLPNSPQATLETINYINIMALSFGFLGIQTIIIGAIRGTGATKTAMLLSLTYLFSTIILTWILPHFMQHKGIWWAQNISIILTMIMGLVVITKFNWEKERAI